MVGERRSYEAMQREVSLVAAVDEGRRGADGNEAGSKRRWQKRDKRSATLAAAVTGIWLAAEMAADAAVMAKTLFILLLSPLFFFFFFFLYFLLPDTAGFYFYRWLAIKGRRDPWWDGG